MSRTFREWNPDQSWLFPPSPQDWLPDGHLVYFLMDVSEQLDLSPIMEREIPVRTHRLANVIKRP
jgi:hypothetical protein